MCAFMALYMCMYVLKNMYICIYIFFTDQFMISFPMYIHKSQNVDYKQILELEWIQSHIHKISRLVKAQPKI